MLRFLHRLIGHQWKLRGWNTKKSDLGLEFWREESCHCGETREEFEVVV